MRFRKWFRLRQPRLFGASIYIHWSVLALIAVLAAFSISSPIHAFVAIASYLGVIVTHELGHAYVARRRGLEVLSIHIGLLHGRCDHEAPDHEWDDVAIAWGGVLAQLLIAIPFLIFGAVFNEAVLEYLGAAVLILGYLNLLIALLNLAPANGLDGEVAWRIIPLLRARWVARRATDRARRRWKR
jgi:Zn-dependent protease